MSNHRIVTLASTLLAALCAATFLASCEAPSFPDDEISPAPPTYAGDAVVHIAMAQSSTTSGGDHISVCALLANGQVKCWGNNSYGQLGLGDTVTRGDAPGEMGANLPSVNLGAGRTAVKVAGGGSHYCAILDNGSVKCWGLNSSGELGQGDTNNRGDGPNEMGDSLPAVSLGTGRTAVAVTAASDHTCVILDDRTVKCWGGNSAGQLGLGDTTNRGDAANEMGSNLPVVNLGSGRTAIGISAAFYHTCAILDDGTLKCWGNNASGELGLGDTTDRGTISSQMGNSLTAVSVDTTAKAIAVSAGAGFTCALLDNSGVKCWGGDPSGTLSLGQLGQGSTATLGDGANEMGANLPLINLGTGRTAVRVSAGQFHACAVLDNGTVKCWGNNGNGQLGLGDGNNRGDGTGEMGDSLPAVDAGSGLTAINIWAMTFETCALLSNGRLKCWGYNGQGQLGQGNTTQIGKQTAQMGDALAPIDLGSAASVSAVEVAAGDAHVCARLSTGGMKCWGRGATGQLGQGSTGHIGDGTGEMGSNLHPINLGTGLTPRNIAAGQGHTCAILSNGSVKCWGYNVNGQLGLGDTVNRGDTSGEMDDTLLAVNLGTGRTARAVSAGQLHTCALLDNGAVKCWGYNATGQLGQDNITNLGSGSGDMAALAAINLGTGRTGRAIAAGANHTCALLDNSTVKCWGDNAFGQLGQGTTTDAGAGGTTTLMASLAAINLGTGRTAMAIAVGDNHSCALLDNGSVKCWGYNLYGQLGQGNTTNLGSSSADMGSLAAINLGTGRTARGIAAGSNHTCALLDNGTAKCWGQNTNGQLGQGNTTNRGGSSTDMANLSAINLGTGRSVAAIAAGGDQSCALLDNGGVKCWGENLFGGLGLGDAINRGDGSGEMGDSLAYVDLGTSGIITYAYGFEPGTLEGWTATGAWGVTNSTAANGTYAVTDSPTGNYSTSTTTTLTSPKMDLSKATSATLAFNHKYTLATGTTATVLVSTNGGATYTTVATYTAGTVSSFTAVALDISSYRSATTVVQFKLATGSTAADGWYLDDIVVNGY